MNDKLTELLNRPATHVLTTRVDGRYLATLASFWYQRGERIRSSSELIRLSLEAFAELLVTNQQVEFVSTHSAAVDILDRLGMSTKEGTNKTALARALASEDSSISLSSLTIAKNPLQSTKIKGESFTQSNPSVQMAQTLLERSIEEELITRVIDANARSAEFRESLGIPVPTTSSGLIGGIVDPTAEAVPVVDSSSSVDKKE